MKALSLTRQRAFTLIELLVVVLIIGILIAVAAPSFLGQASKAQDSAVEQQLAVSTKEAKSIWTTNGQAGEPTLGSISTSGTLLYQLHTSEPQYTYADGSSGSGAATGTIDVWTPDANTVGMCELSNSGTYYCVEAQEASASLAVLASFDPSSGGLFGLPAAQAASTTSIVYTTGSTEAAARCPLNDVLPSSDTPYYTASCSTYSGQYSTSPSGWTNPIAGSQVKGSGASAPADVASPAITGTAAAGQTLLSSPGSWSGSPTSYLYQWQDCNAAGQACVNIAGATASSYQVQTSDAGDTLVVNVAAVNSGGTSAYSASAATLAATAPPSATGVPTITNSTSGAPRVTFALTGGSDPAWSGFPAPTVTRQWMTCTSTAQSSCTALVGQTAATYTPARTDIGHYLEYEDIAMNSTGTVPSVSAQTSAVGDVYESLVQSHNPVLYMPLNDANGALAPANSGSQSFATAYAGSAQSTVRATGPLTADPNGSLSTAFKSSTSDGATAAVDLSAYSVITVEFWLYEPTWPAAGTNAGALTYNSSGNNFYVTTGFHSSSSGNYGVVSIEQNGAGNLSQGTFVGTTPTAGAWHEYDDVFSLGSSSTVTTYVDGVNVGTAGSHWTSTVSGNFGSGTLDISNQGGSAYNTGDMAQLAIYPGNLGSTAIARNYQLATTGN